MKKLTLLFIIAFGFGVQSRGQVKGGMTDLEWRYANKQDSILGKINRWVDTIQTNTYVVEYDFKTGIFNRNNLKLKVNQPTIFRIVNINRLAYDVEIVAKDSTLAISLGTPVIENVEKSTAEMQKVEVSNAAVIETASILVAGKANADDLTDTSGTSRKLFEDIRSKGEQLDNLAVKIGVARNQIAIVKSNIESMKQDSLRNIVEKTGGEQENSDSIRCTCIDPYDKGRGYLEEERSALAAKLKDLERDLDSNKVVYGEIEKRLRELEAEQEGVFAFFLRKKGDYSKLFSEFNALYKDFSKITEYQHILDQAIDDPYLTHLDIGGFGNEYGLDSVKIGLRRIRKQFSHLYELAQQLNSLYYEIRAIPLSGYFKGNKAELEMLEVNMRHKIVENIAGVIQSQSLDKQATSMLHTISLLENEDTYVVTSTPIQPTQDLAEFSISITQKNGDNKVKNGKHFKHREFTRGGIRLDAGIGIAATYLPNAPSYDLVSEGTGYKIAVDQEYQFAPSVVLLGTATIRSTRSVAFGGSAGVGVGVNTDGESLLTLNNYYLGFTAMFGKTNRFALTSGINLKEVNRLRAGYKVDKIVPDKDIVYTRNGYKIGPFFAVTYNLTKGVKDNIQYVKSFLK